MAPRNLLGLDFLGLDFLELGFLPLLLTALVGASCASPSDDRDRRDDGAERTATVDRQEPTAPRSSSEQFFIVERLDLRKCAWPWCGGVFVKEVNEATSSCADGSTEADCYVSQIDWSALALEPNVEAELSVLPGRLLMRGNLVEVDHVVGKIPALQVTGLWQGVTGNTPTGDFSLVQNNGIVCITYPCPTSFNQLVLNTQQLQTLAGVDVLASGASNAQAQAAWVEMDGDGLMVAGQTNTVTGPGGSALELAASELYAKVADAKPTETCGDSVCGTGEYCCNSSCGICAPLGGACIQLACAPCAHDVCAQGVALDSTCSSCAGKVCAADDYCCNNAWDGICVKEAEQLCGDSCSAPEPPPTPGCAHDVCATGGKLDSACSSCALTVCTADSFCCNNSWDSLCVQQAQSMCSECSAPAACEHPESSTGVKLTPECSSCATTVCASDAYCCENSWDQLCVKEAAQLCP